MTSIWKSRALRPAVNRLDRRVDRRIEQVTHEEFQSLKNELEEFKAELLSIRPELYALELLLGKDGRNKTRLPTKAEIMKLCAEITATSGHAKPYSQVAQGYRTLVELELRGVGRLAGGTSNVLGKLTTTALLDPPNGLTLEIGTLYGIFSGGMARQLTRRGLEYDLTIVDPLADVQLQPEHADFGADPSGTPVSELVARANLALAGVDPGRLRIIRGFSDDPAVQRRAADREYGVVIIDGDHSEQGVLNDLAWVEQLAAPGGIIVIDDYGDPGWPGVTAALDGHLKGRTRFELLGTVSTSAFLRAGPLSR
jgi:hypothetical protein